MSSGTLDIGIGSSGDSNPRSPPHVTDHAPTTPPIGETETLAPPTCQSIAPPTSQSLAPPTSQSLSSSQSVGNSDSLGDSLTLAEHTMGSLSICPAARDSQAFSPLTTDSPPLALPIRDSPELALPTRDSPAVAPPTGNSGDSHQQRAPTCSSDSMQKDTWEISPVPKTASGKEPHADRTDNQMDTQESSSFAVPMTVKLRKGDVVKEGDDEGNQEDDLCIIIKCTPICSAYTG